MFTHNISKIFEQTSGLSFQHKNREKYPYKHISVSEIFFSLI